MSVGRILTSRFVERFIKKNVDIVLRNYNGISCAHYRRSSEDARTKDFYDDFESSSSELDFEFLGHHMIHISSNDYDTLVNGGVHYEDDLPLEALLSPESTWEEHDEIMMEIDTEDGVFSDAFEIVNVLSESHSGVTIYRKCNLAPVREDREFN